MEDLKQYLLNPDKTYDEGLILYQKYSKKEKLQFFKSNNSPMHLNMMLRDLGNVYRIALQNEKLPKQPEPIQIGNKPIVIPKKHFSEVETELQQSKMLTNKLLARDWTELDQKEQKYFKNDAVLFAQKKDALIENSRIESELKSLHAQIQLAKTDGERQELGERMVKIKKQQAENWTFIDNDEPRPVKEEKPEKTANFDKAELLLKRNNLRARISKLQKQTSDPSAKKYKENIQKLEDCRNELEEINKLL